MRLKSNIDGHAKSLLCHHKRVLEFWRRQGHSEVRCARYAFRWVIHIYPHALFTAVCTRWLQVKHLFTCLTRIEQSIQRVSSISSSFSNNLFLIYEIESIFKLRSIIESYSITHYIRVNIFFSMCFSLSILFSVFQWCAEDRCKARRWQKKNMLSERPLQSAHDGLRLAWVSLRTYEKCM